MNNARQKRIARELNDAVNYAQADISILYDSQDKNSLTGVIAGPIGSVYEGGIFMINIKLPNQYPFRPPVLKFDTKIYHPNINNKGQISCCQVKAYSCSQSSTWSPALKIIDTLKQLKQIMVNPNADDCLMVDVGQQYKNDKQKFDKIAKEWVKKYAM